MIQNLAFAITVIAVLVVRSFIGVVGLPLGVVGHAKARRCSLSSTGSSPALRQGTARRHARHVTTHNYIDT